ncbi:hypothetical protein BDN71DRAFT_1505740 [Pleurotus eryngii]|uniref:Uncharacterized protein n=1 Tax=Pleurotus eryngii TaxID=5323 RepID=A0A9P6D9J7_PLEER|nr:hypothetical protein BDN71DRAFT_1505740 [Pleurotus eryngii]
MAQHRHLPSIPTGYPRQKKLFNIIVPAVWLTFDGYNNTGALVGEGTPDTPLPAALDTTLLNCLNATIINNVPLVDATGTRWSAPSIALLPLFWIAWFLSARL